MAVVEIYISNFIGEGGAIDTTSTLFQSVPVTPGENIIDPRVKSEMGKAPTFEFTMNSTHPMYDRLLQMRTMFRVVYGGQTIFRGRALTIDVDMLGRKSVHCEGDFAFLMDTVQPGSKEDSRQIITVAAYLDQLIAQHNSTCGDPLHQFYLGECPGHYTDEGSFYQQRIIPAAERNSQKFGNTSWNTTMDRFEDLLNDFGGYWRTRYEDDTHVYLDWFDRYFRPYDVSRQRIEVASNLIDFGGSNEVDNIFTVVIPVGKQDSKDLFLTDYWPMVSSGHARVNYITVPEIADLGIFTDEALNTGHHSKEDYQNAINRYGYIYKVVNFENADTEDKLFSYATDWIKNNYMGSVTSYDVTALDIQGVNLEQSPLLIGDEVELVHPSIGLKVLTIISIDYDLYNPWKTKYNIGSPNNLLNATYGVANKKNNGGKKSGGGASTKPPNDGEDEDAIFREQERARLLTQYSIKTDQGIDIPLDDQLAFLSYDTQGNKLPGTTTEEKKALLSKIKGVLPELRKIVQLPGWKTDPEFLINSGQFPLLKEARDAWRGDFETYALSVGLNADEAAILTHNHAGTTWISNIVDDNGNLKPEYNHPPYNTEKLTKMANTVRQSLTGQSVGAADLALSNWNPIQMAGDFLGIDLTIDDNNFVYDSDLKSFVFGNGQVRFDSQGRVVEFDDMHVIRKTTDEHGETLEFGFYDEGNLTGGIMITKINEDETELKIKGSKVDIEANDVFINALNSVGSVIGLDPSKWEDYDGVTLQELNSSAIWQDRNSITNFVGDFEVRVDENGNKTLVIKTGGGVVIQKDNVELGLYDEGTLDAGVIVQKLKDGQSQATITADLITMSAGDSTTVSENITNVVGSTLWQNESLITNVVGEFDIVTDPETGKKTLVIKSGGGLSIRRDGTEFGVYDNGTLDAGVIVQKLRDGATSAKITADLIELTTGGNTYTVASRFTQTNNAFLAYVGKTIDECDSYNGARLSQISGSNLWLYKDNITGLVGEFDVVEDETTHEKTVVVKSGGGLSIKRNNTEFGVYDSGTLDAGVIVQKLKDGKSEATITADLITIGDTNAQVAINGKVTMNQVEGKIAEYDFVSATNLESELAKLTAVAVGGLRVTGGTTLNGLVVEGNLNVLGSIGVGGKTFDGSVHKGTPTSKVSGGKITLTFPTVGGNSEEVNFNIADTAFYKSAVGVKSVFLTDDSSIPYYSNGVLFVSVSASPNAPNYPNGQAWLQVNASNAYSAGYDAGYRAGTGGDSGGGGTSGSITTSWSNNTCTIHSGTSTKNITIAKNSPQWTTTTRKPGTMDFVISCDGGSRLTFSVDGRTPYEQGLYDAGVSPESLVTYEGGYNAGVSDANSAITMSGSWNNSTYTARNSGNSRTATTTISIDTGSWEGDTYERLISVKDANGITITSTPISASAVWTVGNNAGKREITNKIAISTYWSDNTCAISDGVTSTKAYLTITAGTPVYSSSTRKFTVPVYCDGGTRLRVEVPDAQAYNYGYNKGWNDCIDACTSHTYLRSYSTFNRGVSVALYNALGIMATGEKQVWRYGGNETTAYTIPQKRS